MIVRLLKKIVVLTVASILFGMVFMSMGRAEVTEYSFTNVVSIERSYTEGGKEVKRLADVEVKVKHPHIFLENAVASEKINSAIAEYVNERCSINVLEKDYVNIKNLSIGGSVKRIDDKYVSVVMNYYIYPEDAPHGFYGVNTFTFDANTGEVLPLDHFVKLTEEDIEKETRENLLSIGDTPIERGKFYSISDPVKYYVNEKDEVYLLFDPYEMADYASGLTHVVLTPEKQKMYNSR